MGYLEHDDLTSAIVDFITHGQSPTRIRHKPSSLLSLRHPWGRGSEASLRMAETIRFLMGRSRRLRLRSALDAMKTLNIDIAGGAPISHHIFDRTARFRSGLGCGSAYVEVFHHFLVLFNRKYDGLSLPFGVDNELYILVYRSASALF